MYELNPEGKKSGAGNVRKEEGLTAAQMKSLEQELERTGVSLEAVLDRYGLKDAGRMTPEIYKKALGGLKRTKPKEAA